MRFTPLGCGKDHLRVELGVRKRDGLVELADVVDPIAFESDYHRSWACWGSMARDAAKVPTHHAQDSVAKSRDCRSSLWPTHHTGKVIAKSATLATKNRLSAERWQAPASSPLARCLSLETQRLPTSRHQRWWALPAVHHRCPTTCDGGDGAIASTQREQPRLLRTLRRRDRTEPHVCVKYDKKSLCTCFEKGQRI